ncbi:hypothetical protein [Microbacterium sp. PMB16]|uniref:hypothetical protein n=1 Tax=Microbacterium sp. PMB16 TaxID=3120157 RepID=UPI003F4B5746
MSQRLHAGSWTVELDEQSALRTLRLGDEEILTGIAGIVRDADWQTIPGAVTVDETTIADDGFRVRFRSVHLSEGIDFAWTGTITGQADSTIRFEFDGAASVPLVTNRIGLVVLHALGAAGRPVQVTHTSGDVEASAFPALVAPHQPFLDVSAFRQTTRSGAEVEIVFDGEVFETEDQRNWSDASFKTYSRPLALPFPFDLAAGETVRQSVTVRATGQLPPRFRPDAAPVQLHVGTTAPWWPRIGLGLSSVRDPGADAAIQALRPAWVRVDVRLDAEGTVHGAEAVAHARHLGLPVELAVTVAAETPTQTLALTGLLAAGGIAHVLAFTEDAPTTTAASAEVVRGALAAAGISAPLIAGTDAHLAELNRFPLTAEGLAGVCLPIDAQVHDTDDLAVMRTTESYADMITAARGRARAGGYPERVAVSPVTLRRCPESDPRQCTAFAAAWTVGVLVALAAAGVARVTLFPHAGPGGVLDTDGTWRPVAEVLAVAFAAERVLPVVADHGEGVTGFVAETPDEAVTVLANRTAAALTVRLSGAFEAVIPPFDTVILRRPTGSCGAR